MLKRNDIQKVERLDTQLSNIELGLRYFREAETLEVTGVGWTHRIELKDYDPPSDIGEACAKVRAAIVAYYEKLAHNKRAELSKLGVKF